MPGKRDAKTQVSRSLPITQGGKRLIGGYFSYLLLHNKALKTENTDLLFVMMLLLSDAWLGDSASGGLGWDH